MNKNSRLMLRKLLGPKKEENLIPVLDHRKTQRFCFVQNRDTGTVHIACCVKENDSFECYKENIVNLNCKSMINKLKLEYFNVSPYLKKDISKRCFTLDEIRKIAAILANLGINICAKCISMFYTNNL